jgi:hypothetical protein
MLKKIEQEIKDYRTGTVELSEGITFSAAKLIKRISLYKAKTYPTGKIDSQGNYKYYFDIISPRVNNEVKNVDFDTSDIELFSDARSDVSRVILANDALREYMDESGEAMKLNEAVERSAEWGNVVWKKTKDGYTLVELTKFMVLNQTAFSLAESDTIEEACLSASQLLSMTEWKNTKELMKAKQESKSKKVDFYVYERCGELTEKEYYSAKNGLSKRKIYKDDYLESKYVNAKVVVGGIERDKPTFVLYCDLIDESPYKEHHRSSYSGRWFREGLYEMLFDVQTRANEIGNQIARGLEWAAKTIFTTSERVIAQNIITDLDNGDVIKANDLRQLVVRMEGLDQLIADWNRLMSVADALANSSEIVTGESAPSGTPFRLGALQNINANKLFDFLREKLSVSFQEVLSDWILSDMLKYLKAKDVIKLTDDEDALMQYYVDVVAAWYIQNLLSFPPHSEEMAAEIKRNQIEILVKNKTVLAKSEREMWASFKPRLRVSITGENYKLQVKLETLQTFIALEADPVRRTALIEQAMALKGINAKTLPKSPPQPLPSAVSTQSASTELINANGAQAVA